MGYKRFNESISCGLGHSAEYDACADSMIALFFYYSKPNKCRPGVGSAGQSSTVGVTAGRLCCWLCLIKHSTLEVSVYLSVCVGVLTIGGIRRFTVHQ